MAMLENLKKIVTKEKKRRGRGASSGVGGTSGRGSKGEKARTGKKISPWFEGGQTPLYRRLPKRGFTNPSSIDYEILNVADLNRFEDGSVINEDLLRDEGLLKKNKKAKILGSGVLVKRLTVEDVKLSRSAKEKIEGVGGTVVTGIAKKEEVEQTEEVMAEKPEGEEKNEQEDTEDGGKKETQSTGEGIRE